MSVMNKEVTGPGDVQVKTGQRITCLSLFFLLINPQKPQKTIIGLEYSQTEEEVGSSSAVQMFVNCTQILRILLDLKKIVSVVLQPIKMLESQSNVWSPKNIQQYKKHFTAPLMQQHVPISRQCFVCELFQFGW